MENYDKKINRVEVIDWTKDVEEGGGGRLVDWANDIFISTDLQDDGRTLKVFINKR